MTDFSAAAMKGGQSPHAPLIERRQRKSSPHHHIMCLDVPHPSTVALRLSAGKELAQKEKKSKMDPEFEEIKGFMDLGFEFRNDQFTPRLLMLLPGLNRSIDHENSTRIVGFEEAPFQNWELPNPNAGGVDMKEYLKLWARSVASTLKC